MAPKSGRAMLSQRTLRITAIAAAILAALIVVLGITSRKMADARLSEWTEKQATPVVSLAKIDSRGKNTTLDLPGRLQAYSQAQLFARVSGYIREWKVDIGMPVKAGDVLAEIDAPDLDQQIMQAQADVATAQANATISEANMSRAQSLIKSGSVSKQDLDQRTADSASRAGLLKSQQANLDRLRVLESYKRITAPFDGLVTSRATDVGALINAGAGGGPALFVVSDITKLRVYVNVPQNYVPSVRIGAKAKLTVPEYPNKSFVAVVEASAQSVEAASGTTRMQLVVDNAGGELMTGGFANVHLELPHAPVAINVPASALIFGRDGLQVATLGSDSRVVLKKVRIARDLGKVIEIGAGLEPDDRVIETPPDGVATGDAVRVAGAPGTPQGATPGTADAEQAPGKPPG